MNKRLFFLKQDGWFEAEVTEKLLNSSNEELFRWAYAMMDRHNYRNYLITENPEVIIGGRASLRATQSKCSVSEDTCKCVAKQSVSTGSVFPSADRYRHPVTQIQIASSAIPPLQNRIIQNASSQ